MSAKEPLIHSALRLQFIMRGKRERKGAAPESGDRALPFSLIEDGNLRERPALGGDDGLQAFGDLVCVCRIAALAADLGGDVLDDDVVADVYHVGGFLVFECAFAEETGHIGHASFL